MSKKRRILILCTGNSARSQMAEGILKNLVIDRFDVYSAGTRPSTVRPEAIEALAEIGIDISQNYSKSVDEFAGINMDFVLTVCDHARESCPHFPAGTRLIHHSFEDPAESQGDEENKMAVFRRVRDDIRDYLAAEFFEIIGLVEDPGCNEIANPHRKTV